MSPKTSANARAYRRGAVLGLTIGEVFVLISFMLLLLLLLWRTEVSAAQSKSESVEAELAELESFRQLDARTLKQLASALEQGWPQEVLEMAEDGRIGDPRRIPEQLRDANEPQALDLLKLFERQSPEVVERLTDLLSGNSNIEKQLSLLDQYGGLDPDLLTQAMSQAQLLSEVDQDILEVMAEVANALSPVVVKQLKDLLGDAQNLPLNLALLEQVSALPPAEIEMLSEWLELSIEKLKVLNSAGTDAVNRVDIVGWTTISEALDKLAWDPDKLESAALVASDLGEDPRAEVKALRERVQQALDMELDRSSELATTLRARLAEIVEANGGNISAEGFITLPDATLFVTGKSDLTDNLAAFLDTICEPWFAALRNLDFEVGELRIEGHASTVWGESEAREAYLNNLKLSQDRARTVLAYCLDKTWGSSLNEWARNRAVAIGYSSSRLIVDGSGQEDEPASQRVVLSAQPERDDVIRAIGEAVE